jgi:hypothetical protein
MRSASATDRPSLASTSGTNLDGTYTYAGHRDGAGSSRADSGVGADHRAAFHITNQRELFRRAEDDDLYPGLLARLTALLQRVSPEYMLPPVAAAPPAPAPPLAPAPPGLPG